MNNPTAHDKTIDDYLGDSGTRFFSSGYRRVRYKFGHSEIASSRSSATMATRVALRYPDNWSKKRTGVSLRPHLSTIDAILLGVQAGEALLTHTFALSDDARRAMWVRRIDIRAGQRPDEELDELPVTAQLAETRQGTDRGTTARVDCRVGAMRVRCEIDCPGARFRERTSEYESLDELVGPPENRYYGTGFGAVGHRIAGLDIDLAALRATAEVDVTPTTTSAGIEGAYQPTPTIVETFAAGLQLGQVLLYTVDAMTRSDSDTLWMRTTSIVNPHPRQRRLAALPLTVTLGDPKLIEMSGRRWRTATILAVLDDISFTCATTHALPEPSARQR